MEDCKERGVVFEVGGARHGHCVALGCRKVVGFQGHIFEKVRVLSQNRSEVFDQNKYMSSLKTEEKAGLVKGSHMQLLYHTMTV